MQNVTNCWQKNERVALLSLIANSNIWESSAEYVQPSTMHLKMIQKTKDRDDDRKCSSFHASSLSYTPHTM